MKKVIKKTWKEEALQRLDFYLSDMFTGRDFSEKWQRDEVVNFCKFYKEIKELIK